jgi:hypothetical protein
LSDDPFLLESAAIQVWKSSFGLGKGGRVVDSVFFDSIEVAICGDPVFHAISCIFKEVGKFAGEVSAYKCSFDKEGFNGGIDVGGNAMLTGEVNQLEGVCRKDEAASAASGRTS